MNGVAMKPIVCLLAAVFLIFATGSSRGADRFRVLVFSKTLLYRHASITNGIKAVRALGAEHQFGVDASEDSAVFTSANLARYQVVMCLSTSGDVLDKAQQVALKDFVEHGGGLVGVHAGIPGKVATAGSWGWYADAFCAEFANHKAIEPATVVVEDSTTASTAHLPPKWTRTDEWYNFVASPRGKVHVLATLDEASFHGGTMGADHPVAWFRKVGAGRLWYTALGHTEASYGEPMFVRHLLGGIEIAAGTKPADFTASPSRKP